MSYLENRINPVSPAAPALETGPWIYNGDLVVLDAETPQYFKFIHVGIGGDVMIEGINGQVIPFLGLLDGEWIPVIGKKVLSTTAKGNTTATGLTWHGGA